MLVPKQLRSPLREIHLEVPENPGDRTGQQTKYLILRMHVMGVHTHVNFGQTNGQNVGMQVVRHHVSHHVTQHVPDHVLVVVLTILENIHNNLVTPTTSRVE